MRLFKQSLTNIATWKHTYHQSPTQLRSVCTLLTVHVHQDADVGVSHSVEDLTGHGLGEEGVISCGDKHTLSGALQQHAAFCPSNGETHPNLTTADRCDVCLSAGNLKSMIGFYHVLMVSQMLFSHCKTISIFILSIKAIKLTFKKPQCQNLQEWLQVNEINVSPFLLFTLYHLSRYIAQNHITILYICH